jgi:SAM-dependent methyltransferase
VHKVNYNEISQVYDDVRQADVELINNFLQEIEINTSTKILDIGCGTGNNTDLLQKVTQSNVYGIDPSVGMLSKAWRKNNNIVFKLGNAEYVPFEDECFDFVYMTDVIHHVSDIKKMFAEINRVLKKEGKACIVTQSHYQIEKRPIVEFFPGTATVDKGRYPDINKIIVAAEGQHLKFMKNAILYENEEIELGLEYLDLARKKGYSMLHLISDKEYSEGLKRLETKLKNGKIRSKLSGETLVWFVK